MNDSSHAQCPRCDGMLVSSTHEGFEHASCSNGCGIFVTHDALKGMVRSTEVDRPDHWEQDALGSEGEISREELVKRHGDTLLPCPGCRQDMERYVYAMESGVVIDQCDDHGVWLDDGELARIESWYEGDDKRAATQAGAALAATELATSKFIAREMADDEVGKGPVRSFLQRMDARTPWARL